MQTTVVTYLRENGLNVITWDYFTGDFHSVLRYLERIADHVYEQFKVDHTEIFSRIFTKDNVNDWVPEARPTEKELQGHTHILLIDGYTDDSTYAEVVTVSTLQGIESILHHTIAAHLAVS